ncbi:MAG: replication-associated recombination protein A [Bdellovibrionaceae bacterium]|nr:replication-associated recombination protein A [Pseudobdellovibrionaceae bacterium]
MDLFSHGNNPQLGVPLAETLRPKTLAEFMTTAGPTLKRLPISTWLQKDFLPNLILWGPPGTGKTTFVRLLESETKWAFLLKNATDLSTKEMKAIGDEGLERKRIYQKKTVLFIDEIHRLNKGQQDTLLPHTEAGHFILLGATTENPNYELNRALLSRSRIVTFTKPEKEILSSLYYKACQQLKADADQFLSSEALQFVTEVSDGDVRRFYNLIEILFYSNVKKDTPMSELETLLEKKYIGYDKKGSVHYDTISAFIKSIRGSDTNAALLYLVKMLDAGEDPVFVARRLVILASEDIGNAEPRALTLAINGLQAVELVGMPEAEIVLAHVVTFLASCPKSNRSYKALHAARAFFKLHSDFEIPDHLRSGNIPDVTKNYKYPHDFPKSWVAQDYLPKDLTISNDFYQPNDFGQEKNLRDFIQWLKKTNTEN